MSHKGKDGWRYALVQWPKSLKPSRRRHYFVDGRSLCGKHFDSVHYSPFEGVPNPHRYTKCKECDRRLMKLERKIITEWRKKPVDLIFPLGYERKCKGLCPTCKKPVDVDRFEKEIEWKEYQISGMCKDCQDDVFGDKG